jgi:RNA polymerase sigma factor (sigma-70 family)
MSQVRRSKLEAILARLARSREDKEAWTLLYNLMWAHVLTSMFRALHGLHDTVEDASQEVFIRLLRYCDFRKLRKPDDFQCYLYTVVQNVAKDHLRSKQQLAVDIERQDDEKTALLKVIPIITPERVVHAEQLLQQVWDELDAEERCLVELLVEGRTTAEIAQRFGWSYSNAGVRVHRLRLHLKRSLKEKKIS